MAILSNVDNNGGVIMIYTGSSPESIIASGVIPHVRFNMDRAADVKYVVCCQNAELDGATEPHNAAFLIGRVSDFSPPYSQGYRNIRISEYATILKRNVWNVKNPEISHLFFPGLRQAKVRLGRHTFQPIGSAPQGLRKTSQALRNQEPMKRQEIPADIRGDLRTFIANKLGVKVSQVNVTVTISKLTRFNGHSTSVSLAN